MAEIVLCRIDSRLIHGQVMTKWVNQVQANKIVVISDELAADDFLRSIYLMAAPSGVEVICLSEKDSVESWLTSKFGTGRVLLLLPNVEIMRRVSDKGIEVEKIQIGGLGGAPNRKVVYQNITLDNQDAEDIQYLLSKNIDIVFQTIPEDNPKKAKDIIAKFY